VNTMHSLHGLHNIGLELFFHMTNPLRMSLKIQVMLMIQLKILQKKHRRRMDEMVVVDRVPKHSADFLGMDRELDRVHMLEAVYVFEEVHMIEEVQIMERV